MDDNESQRRTFDGDERFVAHSRRKGGDHLDPNRAQKRLPPPVYFLLAIGGMVLLHNSFPLVQWLNGPWRWLGFVPVVLSGVIAVTARSQFRRQGTTVRPFEAPTVLVTGGVFRISRNPMYLALVLILLGIGVCLGTASPWVVVPVFVWLITVNVVRCEEESLAAQFGDAYARYRREVRRWI